MFKSYQKLCIKEIWWYSSPSKVAGYTFSFVLAKSEFSENLKIYS